MHLEKRRTVEPRAAASFSQIKKYEKETKQYKRNARETQHNIRPEDTSSRHLWLINYGERTSTSPLPLGYPLLGPSRHVRAYYCMAKSSNSLFIYSSSDPSRHETFRPLFRRPASSPLVLGCCSRSMVGVDAKSSEVVQETPHPLFFLIPHAARAPHQFSEHHALRQSRILHARHKLREQDPPPVKSRLDALTSRLDNKRVQI